ncbi:MAG: S1C family serine protease [Fimbriimonadales bacterium]|nr:S1C family serine protease [Fimbriimonadales bacterium]
MRPFWFILLCLPLYAWTQATPEPGAAYKQVLEKIQPNIVTVRTVIKVEVKAEDENQSEESKFTLQGAVLNSDGLVLVSGVLLSSESFKQLIGMEDESGVSLTISPQSFKVIFGSETKEYDAKLVATDSQLGIAFLKITNLEGRAITPITFVNEDLAIGKELLTVSRLPKGFDYAPYFSTGRIISEVNKPRKAYLMEGNISELGLPVYNMKGEAVGVLVVLRHGLKDEEADFGFRANFGEDDSAAFLLPTSALRPLIEQAVQRAASGK